MPVVTTRAASQNGGLATVLVGSAAPTVSASPLMPDSSPSTSSSPWTSGPLRFLLRRAVPTTEQCAPVSSSSSSPLSASSFRPRAPLVSVSLCCSYFPSSSGVRQASPGVRQASPSPRPTVFPTGAPSSPEAEAPLRRGLCDSLSRARRRQRRPPSDAPLRPERLGRSRAPCGGRTRRRPPSR